MTCQGCISPHVQCHLGLAPVDHVEDRAEVCASEANISKLYFSVVLEYIYLVSLTNVDNSKICLQLLQKLKLDRSYWLD